MRRGTKKVGIPHTFMVHDVFLSKGDYGMEKYFLFIAVGMQMLFAFCTTKTVSVFSSDMMSLGGCMFFSSTPTQKHYII